MSTGTSGGRRGILAAATAVLAVAGGLAVAAGLHQEPGPPQPYVAVDAPPTRATPVVPEAPVTTSPAAPVTDLGLVLPASVPVAVDIPSIDVHATTLMPLTVGDDGVLPPPSDYALAGWYTGGPNPGQLGPAVIAGHVDGPDGPAVFYRLGQLVAGAEVDVTRQDGTVARFTIDMVASYAKADFPTSLVYGNTTDRAEIRLITCGGVFDHSTGHYVDNVVAFGHLVG
jgi:hypothetical protein